MRAAQISPWKAAHSYGPTDGDLFHGRDAEGMELAQFLRERPLSVVTAPSGMGKTSLLLASSLPQLEREHWFTAYARPEEDPLRSLQGALSRYLLPDLSAEIAVVARIAASAPVGETTISGAIDWHNRLDRETRIALRFFSDPTNADTDPLPAFCRALRGSLSVADLIEHFEAAVGVGPSLELTPLTPLDDLRERLADRATQQSSLDLQRRLAAAASLTDAIELLQAEWVPLRPGLSGILLILDQFEEVITRLKPNVIDAVTRQSTDIIAANERYERPIHLAFSLRKEFFADLVPFLKPFGSAERITFFLSRMGLSQARQAFVRPGELFGLTFEATADGTRSCLDEIVAITLDDAVPLDDSDQIDLHAGKLPTGKRYAPALISLVGAHLWSRLSEAVEVHPVEMPLSSAVLRELIPSVENVFARFLTDAMVRLHDTFGDGAITSFDALEALDLLVTPGGFRNIIAEDDLVDQIPLSAGMARRLLHHLDTQLRLIRREKRQGGIFVEIVHERLIPSIRQALADLRRREPARGTLAAAHDILYALPDQVDFKKDLLPSIYRDTLLQYRGRVDLDGLARKTLLRSMLIMGPDTMAETDDGESAVAWSDAFLALLGRSTSTTMPGRMPLLTGDALETAIEIALDNPHGYASEDFTHLITSVLADQSEASGARIKRVLSIRGHDR